MLFNHVCDSPGAGTVVPVSGDQVRVGSGYCCIVCCCDVALIRIEIRRQLLKRNVACPFVFVCPSRDRITSVSFCPNRNPSRQLISDVPIHIGVNDVLRGYIKGGSCIAKLGPIPRKVHFPDSRKDVARFQRRPFHGNRVVLRDLKTSLVTEVFQLSIRVGDHRAVPRVTDN